MGFRFDMAAANWLAHVLAPTGMAAPPEPQGLEHGLDEFLGRLGTDFYSGSSHSRELMHRLDAVRHRVRSRGSVDWVTAPLRDFFRDVRYCALLVPGLGSREGGWLRESSSLSRLVRMHPEDPGLILQVETALGPELALTNIFPAVRVALDAAHRWPGVLLWTPRSGAVFLSVPASEEEGMGRMHWIFSRLAETSGAPDLGLLERQYVENFPSAGDRGVIRLLHLSDLHLGSADATRRIPRVEHLLSDLVGALRAGGAEIHAIVTGDLMDTPSDENLDRVRSFRGFLERITGTPPFLVLGNHDVRENGWLNVNLSQVMALDAERMRLLADGRIAVLGFNSALGRRLAQGEIGERALLDAGSALDKLDAGGDPPLKIAVLHHHPHPVQRPDWHRRAWYERILRGRFEATDALADAERFMAWLTARGVRACLHGHKHIPRVDTVDGVVVLGCGSTVGKVDTVKPIETYMSVNVLTVEPARGTITCRLAAERIPGGGLRDEMVHEIVYQPPRVE